MKLFFESVKTKLLDNLSEQGYALLSEGSNDESIFALLQSEKDALKIEYLYENRLFVLSRGEADCAEGDFTRVQSYLFDKDAGDGLRETISVVNEFTDTLTSKQARSYAAQKKKKDKDSDESSAIFFVNRIPTVLPECREPLLRHKEHYEQLLPRHFCSEVVTKAVADMLRNREKAKTRAFFEMVSTLYTQGDLDTQSIIMQVIMPVVSDPEDEKFIIECVPADFKKSWQAAKRWFGKEVKPEKASIFAKASQYQTDTLRDSKR